MAGVASAAPAGPTSQDEVRALVSEMLADADTRSSLLQSGSTAGHEKHFFLASPDGAFKLEIEGQIQFRYIANFREDGNRTRDDFESGFQTRRTKLSFQGEIYDNFFYKVKGAFSRKNGNFELEDSFFGYEFDNGMKIKAGQFKLPFLREELTSSSRQLAVDRSLTNEFFNQDFSQGVQLSMSREKWRGSVAFSDGFKTRNTEFNDTTPGKSSDYAFTGRVEFLGSGNWKQFKDFTSPRGSEGVAWMLGAAAHYQDGPSSLVPTMLDGGSLISWTVDASVEGDGWSAYAAVIGRHTDNKFDIAGGGAGSADQYGLVAQGSYYLTDNFEPFVRWDALVPDNGVVFNALTVGGNYYIHGHAAKFTVDAQWFLDAPANTSFDGASGLGSEKGIGFLGSGGQENEFVLRAQFQLLF